jgi:hypothetical protein
MVNVHKARNADVAFTCEIGQFLVFTGASGHQCMLFRLRGGAWCHQILLLARLAINHRLVQIGSSFRAGVESRSV